MRCSSFGKCGSCVLWQIPYKEQLKIKSEKLKEMFSEFDIPEIEVIYDRDEHFRARAEFRVWREDKLFYAMRKRKEEGRGVVAIKECKIVDKSIYETMPKLLKEIEKSENLKLKLYEIDFLSNSKGELIVTLIYHRKVDETIAKDIKNLKEKFPYIDFIVRKKGRKYVFDKNYLIEELKINGKTYKYKIIENTFSQPNRNINKKMIEWVLKNARLKGDLVELYCGNGNFTIPLSEKFNKVIATEINKESIEAATYNAEINKRENITFLAMSAAEFSSLKEENSFLSSYDLKNVFIDPPRAGLDERSRKFVNSFENIIYISCNPETLKRDLEALSKNRKIKAFAFFDQFPYTNHMECGVILEKIEN